MYKLNVTDTFSAAHKLPGYEGPCNNLHGHNWKVRICVKCEQLDDLGLAMDFRILKTKLGEVLDGLDHQYLNEFPAFQNINPTSEQIAGYIFEQMRQKLSSHPCELTEVEVGESDKTSVVYSL